jgi:nicotinamide-nucleotide amidase
MKGLNVQFLLTGNEIMSGDVIDSNSAMMAQLLKDIGVEISKKTSVSDDLPTLVNEIKNITVQADILIINGGLGPTVDDLTAQALAQAANLSLSYHDEALQHLYHWCEQKGVELNEPNKKQAYLPLGCNIIPNPVGSAVGFYLELNNCQIYCTPGVPSELKQMMQQSIVPSISTKLPNDIHMDVTRLQLFGIGESNLQLMINQQFPDWPDNIEIGFRATMPLLELKLTTRSKQYLPLKQHWLSKVKALLQDAIVGENSTTLATEVVNLLSSQNKKITTVESCTGGLIASQITSVAGSSQAFEAGFVTYSNRIKSKIVSVDEQVLAQHGAVSEPVVQQMLKGALNQSNADIGVAVSGIAGPGGGTIEKPVGMVWIAWGNNIKIKTCCLKIPGNRQFFQQYVAAVSLDLIRRALLNIEEIPIYIKQRVFSTKN